LLRDRLPKGFESAHENNTNQTSKAKVPVFAGERVAFFPRNVASSGFRLSQVLKQKHDLTTEDTEEDKKEMQVDRNQTSGAIVDAAISQKKGNSFPSKNRHFGF